MKLELNFPSRFPQQLIDIIYRIKSRLPKGNSVEYIPLENAMDRIVSENISALNGYPTKNLSEFQGWGVKSNTTINIVENNYLKIKNMYFWDAELYRSKDIYKIDYKDNSIIRLPKHTELPSGIDAVIRSDDVRLDDKDPMSYKILGPINKFEGVIEQGSIIQKGQYLIQREKKINLQNTITLLRAGIKEVEVYKKPRIVVVSMYNYDNQDKISEECIYVKNQLQKWGFSDVEIKILKPIRLENVFKNENEQKNPTINALLASRDEDFIQEFKVLTKNYDLILVCSVGNSASNILNLRKLPIFDPESIDTPINMHTINGEGVKIFKSEQRSPPVKKTIEIYDEQGVFKGITTQIIEDKAVILNLLGNIEDISITMNVGVNYILNSVDPKFIENNFEKGFVDNLKTTDNMQIVFGKYTQDESGKYLIELTNNNEENKSMKFTESNCITIIPSSDQVQNSDIFFTKI